MPELADAHGSGPCGSNTMRVQVSFPALTPFFTGLFFIYKIVDSLVGVDCYGNQDGCSDRSHQELGGLGFLHKAEDECKDIHSDKSRSNDYTKDPLEHGNSSV